MQLTIGVRFKWSWFFRWNKMIFGRSLIRFFVAKCFRLISVAFSPRVLSSSALNQSRKWFWSNKLKFLQHAIIFDNVFICVFDYILILLEKSVGIHLKMSIDLFCRVSRILKQIWATPMNLIGVFGLVANSSTENERCIFAIAIFIKPQRVSCGCSTQYYAIFSLKMLTIITSIKYANVLPVTLFFLHHVLDSIYSLEKCIESDSR